MPPNLVNAQRYRILRSVKKGASVVSPRKGARGIGNLHLVIHTCRDFAKLEGVLASAHKINCIGHSLVIPGHNHGCDLAVGFSLSQGVHVEHELLRAVFRPLKSHVNGVLLTLLVSGLVPVSVHLHRKRCLVRIQTPRHLGIQLFLEHLGLSHACLSVGILGIQVVNDFRVVSVVEPIVLINANVSVPLHAVRTLRGARLVHSYFLKLAIPARTRPKPSLEGACDGLYSIAFM